MSPNNGLRHDSCFWFQLDPHLRGLPLPVLRVRGGTSLLGYPITRGTEILFNFYDWVWTKMVATGVPSSSKWIILLLDRQMAFVLITKVLTISFSATIYS